MKQLVQECKNYAENVEKRVIFHGDPLRKMTPRGTPSYASSKSKSRDSTSISTPTPNIGVARMGGKSSVKPLTISREILSLLSSLLSMAMTEVMMGIIYLHHRAYELEDLIRFSNKLADHLADKGRNATQKNEEKTKVFIRTWHKAFLLYIDRHREYVPELFNHVPALTSMVQMGSIDRFVNRLEEIRNHFPSIQASHGCSRPVVLQQVEDVIILRQPDFEYPLGGSWLDFMRVRRKFGGGMSRLEHMANASLNAGFPTLFASIRMQIAERMRKDVSDNLISLIVGDELGMNGGVEIGESFVESIVSTLTDYIIDTGMSMFAYAVGSTNQVSAVTIQLQAMKVIWLQTPTSFIMPFTDRQITFLSDVVLHAMKRVE